MACKLKLIFVFVIYILNSSFYQNTVAQTVKLPKIPGEILVQLSNNFTPSQIAAEFSAYNLCLKQAIVPSLNIWLFTHQAANQNNLYQAMLRHRGVRQVQYNHLLKSRQTTPNDPNFLYQWQYVNDGNSGGVADADIDADQAWDITTGGFTPLNDEIVVAILDDGVDDTHPDITPNLWVNLNETANNSIDDDGNGYIDDVRGWYNAKNNDQIDGGFFGGSHGTPVCGIVGAKGNNNEGVCGVNWNVKLMVVVMDELTEAEALAGYGYVLANRKLYNETSGKKGAFVVASNASWGIDYGKPADAPLWCTMYDALGEQGVLNVGATANLNINVDVEGDLPTTCPSDYLIAVTNVNNKDIKINAAGYGSTHIDLGAFGEDVYTTADGGKYAPFGGTSGAAPHVTGTIALLYAAACPGFTALAKSKPNEAALAVRTYILQSTDPNTSLTGITATNGRLNTFNALQLTLADPLCNDTICIAPYNLQANDITATQATLNWQLFIAAPTYNLRYKAIETADWQTATTTANSYFISNLLACTTYEFQVQAICEDDIESPYSASGVFTTADCCQAPPALLASQINKTTATVNWQSQALVTQYELSYTPVWPLNWQTLTTTDTFLTVPNLDSCLQYHFKLVSICSQAASASINTVIQTKGCGTCLDANYCTAKGNIEAKEEYIKTVQIGNYTHESGQDGGYMLIDSTDLTLQTTEVYELQLTPGFNSFNFNEYWRIWIDYDQDGLFNPVAELAYDSEKAWNKAIKGSLVIPNTAAPGFTRMRVAMRFKEAPSECGQFSFGEVQDYCIIITPNTGVPQLPPNNILIAQNPFANSIFISIVANKPTNLQLILTNITGQKVVSKDFILTSGINSLSLETSGVPAGMYFLSGYFAGQPHSAFHQKLVK